jgi:hypothetical protein
MASTTELLVRLNVVCRTTVEKKVVDNIHMADPLVYRLFQKGTKKFTGTYYECPISIVKNTNAGFYAAGATFTITAVENMAKARYAAVRLNYPVSIEGLDMALNQGEGKVLDLAAAQIDIATAGSKEIVSTNLYNTTQANSITGLETVCGASGTDLGGIANADATEWLSSSGTLGTGNGPDSVTQTLTKPILEAQYLSCVVNNEAPTIGIGGTTIFSLIESTYLQPNQRYTNASMAQLGFDNYKYKNADMFFSSAAAATDWYFLNENHLGIAVVPGWDFKWIDFETPVNTDLYTGHVRAYFQLYCNSRRHQGWMSAVNAAT